MELVAHTHTYTHAKHTQRIRVLAQVHNATRGAASGRESAADTLSEEGHYVRAMKLLVDKSNQERAHIPGFERVVQTVQLVGNDIIVGLWTQA